MCLKSEEEKHIHEGEGGRGERETQLYMDVKQNKSPAPHTSQCLAEWLTVAFSGQAVKWLNV